MKTMLVLQNRTNTINLSRTNMTKIPTKFKSKTDIKKLVLSDNNIRKIENIPPNIEVLDISKNPLETIDFKELPKTLTELDISECDLHSIKGVHILSNLQILKCSDNNLNIIPKLPDSLIKLVVNSSHVNIFSELPELEILVARNNELTEVKNYPDSIVELFLGDNMITEVIDLPSNLQKLNLANNTLSSIDCELPQSIEHLYLENNNIDEIELPSGVLYCNLAHNNLQSLEIPDELLFLDVSYNRLTYISPEAFSITQFKYNGNRIIKNSEDEIYGVDFSDYNDWSNHSEHSLSEEKSDDDIENVNTDLSSFLLNFNHSDQPGLPPQYNSIFRNHNNENQFRIHHVDHVIV